MWKKSLQSVGFREVGRLTVNTTFFSPYHCNITCYFLSTKIHTCNFLWIFQAMWVLRIHAIYKTDTVHICHMCDVWQMRSESVTNSYEFFTRVINTKGQNAVQQCPYPILATSSAFVCLFVCSLLFFFLFFFFLFSVFFIVTETYRMPNGYD